MTTKLLGQILVKLFESIYLTDGTVSYFSWPSGAMKNLLRHQGVMNRESLKTFGLAYASDKKEMREEGAILLPFPAWFVCHLHLPKSMPPSTLFNIAVSDWVNLHN